jgi:hypothetical protein
MQIKTQIKSIGIDLGKTTFHLVALGVHSQVVIRKKFSRQQLLAYTANLPSCLIGGMCSHHTPEEYSHPLDQLLEDTLQYLRHFRGQRG